MQRSVSWRMIVVGMLVAMLMGATVGVANAVPEERWRNGEFVAARVPVYAASVDGWGCHLFGACRDQTRRPADPQPAWFSQHRWESVLVECYLGHYLKVHQREREGWVLSGEIRSRSRVQPCTAFDF